MATIERPVLSPEQLAKRKYFANVGIRLREALRLHQASGLWERRSDGERDWGNVSEHCLVEAARAEVLAEAVGLSTERAQQLTTAAALHDYFKRQEVALVTERGPSWETYAESSRQSNQILEQAGIAESIRRLAGAVGHVSLVETERIIIQPELSEDDLAYLLMHYIDDYTIGSNEARTADGDINDLDRRMDNLDANPRYQQLNQAGRDHFKGETTFAAQRRIGNQVEQRLADIIQQRTGEITTPKQLPSWVDEQLKQRFRSNNAQ